MMDIFYGKPALNSTKAVMSKCLSFVGAVSFFILLGYYFVISKFMGPVAFAVIFAACLAATVLLSYRIGVKFRENTSFMVAENRVEIRSGLMIQHHLTIPMENIIGFTVRGWHIEKMNLSDIELHTTGGPIKIRYISAEDAESAACILKKHVRGAIRREECNDQPETFESDIKFSDIDTGLYGTIGVTSWYFAYTLTLLTIALSFLLASNTLGLYLSIMMLTCLGAIPTGINILRYRDFKVRRTGSILQIEHGMLQRFSSVFDISEITAVRVKRTMISKLLGRCAIEIELFRSENLSNELTPVICPMIREEQLEDVLAMLLPEYRCQVSMQGEPDGALPIYFKRAAPVAAFLPIAAYLCAFFILDLSAICGNPLIAGVVLLIPLAAVIFAEITIYAYVRRYHMNSGLELCSDRLVIRTGSFDVNVTTIKYDDMSMCDIWTCPKMREAGYARCTILLEKSADYKGVHTGMYEKHTLEKIREKIMGGETQMTENP